MKNFIILSNPNFIKHENSDEPEDFGCFKLDVDKIIPQGAKIEFDLAGDKLSKVIDNGCPEDCEIVKKACEAAGTNGWVVDECYLSVSGLEALNICTLKPIKGWGKG